MAEREEGQTAQTQVQAPRTALKHTILGLQAIVDVNAPKHTLVLHPDTLAEIEGIAFELHSWPVTNE